MSQKLTIKEVKESNKIYNEQIELDVQVGDKEYTVKFKPYFSNIEVKNLVDDIQLFHVNAKKEKLEIQDDEIDDMNGYFIVRHFSDIKMTTSKKAKTLYAEFKEAINSDLFTVILKSIPEESYAKVYDRIKDITELGAKLENQIRQLQQYGQEVKEKHGLGKVENNVQ
jgi:hypothetical protein